MGRRRKQLPLEPFEAVIESMSHDGRGVSHLDGKATFIRGALPGERVMFQYTSKRRRQDEGRCVEVLEAADDRVDAHCASFGICGGCSLQHLDPVRQIEQKFQTLKDNLERIGQVEVEEFVEPLTGPHWGYRHKARLGVRHVRKKEKVLVGFREAGSSKVTEGERCEVLHPRVGERLGAIAELIAGMDARERLPQIEVAVSDDTVALIFRNLDPLSASDRSALAGFGVQHDFDIYLQPGGPDTVMPLVGESRPLIYAMPEFDIRISFRPDDFTQVNTELNRKMVRRAMDWLDPQPDERILDLFCGLGNFTLPIARSGANVTGVEGDEGLVSRARTNARNNGLENVEFYAADLTQDQADASWLKQPYDKMLIDPPRSGALEMLPYVARSGAKRLVYVSCHPGTLARDAGVLVREHGFRIRTAGVMDMFPHTAHVESIALFERD